MTEFIITTLCTLCATAAASCFSIIAIRRKEKKNNVNEGENKGVMMSDIGYIKAGIDDLKRENRETAIKISRLSERITRCEESCKQAHHRIDRYESKGD